MSYSVRLYQQHNLNYTKSIYSVHAGSSYSLRSLNLVCIFIQNVTRLLTFLI